MNPLLKNKLEYVANDSLLIQALRELFAEQVEKEKPAINESDDNALLGEKYRAYEGAKLILERVFIELATYKLRPKNLKTFNKER